MIYLLYTVHVLVSLFLILVVLLQQGKGADLSVFGGGSTQTAFGARSAATVLHKLTVVCFVAFILTTLGIAIMKNTAAGRTVITDDAVVEQEAPAEDEATSTDEATGGEATTDEATPNGSAADGSDAGEATPAAGDAAPDDAATEPANGQGGSG